MVHHGAVNTAGGLPHVSFRVLGPVEAVSDTAGLVDLGGLKQRAVLALLIVSAGRVVSLERVVSELWDEDPPARAISSLQAYVSRLRRLLEPEPDPRQPSRLLQTRLPTGGITVEVAGGWLRAGAFALGMGGALSSQRPGPGRRIDPRRDDLGLTRWTVRQPLAIMCRADCNSTGMSP